IPHSEVRATVALDLLWVGLTLLAVLAFLASVASIVQGIRLRGGVRRAMRLALGAFLPSVAVILPVRGLDVGFDENVRALLSQVYPRYRVLVVADDSADPALLRIQSIAREFPHVDVATILSDPSPLRGKVNALRSALAHLRPEDEVVVFADSDIRPASDWLRQLVQPLADSTIGVATGFRWYLPPQPMFWSLVRAEWNAVSANVLFDPLRSFAWGGSCAVRKDLLVPLRLRDRWRDVFSHDLILTHAGREAGLTIAYAPARHRPRGCSSLEGPRVAARHRRDRGPVGDDCGPPSNAAADHDPMARPHLRRERSAPRPPPGRGNRSRHRVVGHPERTDISVRVNLV